MTNNCSVAVSYGDDLGYIEYDETKKVINVTLANEEGKKKAETFLNEIHKIAIPHETLLDFTEENINPAADVESFKLALTRLWEATGVHVDWSRPVDYVKLHPRYE